MASFMVRSSSGLVSILNECDVQPYQETPALSSISVRIVDNDVNRTPTKRRHQCTKCPKSFTTSGHLTRHLKIHAGVRDLNCPFLGCNKSCGRRDNLIQHFRMHLPKADRKQTYHYIRTALEDMCSHEEGTKEGLETANAETGPQTALQRTPSSDLSVGLVVTNRMALPHPPFTVSNSRHAHVNQEAGRPTLPASASADSSPSLTYSSSPCSLPSSPEYLYPVSRSYETTGDYPQFKVSYARAE